MNALNMTFRYQKQEMNDILAELELFEKMIKDFFTQSGFQDDVQYIVSARALLDMVIRTDKRKVHYYFFHGMTINELKVAALYAYWVLKYRPITLTDERYIYDSCAICINESFAIYIIYSVLRKVRNIEPHYFGNDSYYEKLMYSFRFRNISIDAMLLLVESIAQDTMDQQYSAFT